MVTCKEKTLAVSRLYLNIKNIDDLNESESFHKFLIFSKKKIDFFKNFTNFSLKKINGL